MTDLLEEDAPIFRVTTWELGALPEHDLVVIRLAFLSHPLQAEREADPGRRYVLKLPQAIALQNDLDRLIQRTKAVGFVPPTGDRH